MVRQSELEAARRGALTKLKNAGRVQAQILARFHRLDPSNDRFGIISVDGGPQMRVPVAPGKYVPDTIVVVLIDKAGKPVQVLAPRTDRPDGADEGLVFGAETAWQAIAPRELTPEEAAAIQDTADGLADAQSDLADMAEYAGEEFSRLDTALDELAAGVNGVTYSTEEPSEPGRNEGDTWFQMDGDGTAGFWRWNGTTWQPTEFEDTVLGDVTLGKLRAGSAVVDEAVIGKLWVDGLVARAATFTRATIAAQNLIPGIEALSQFWTLTTEERNASPFREFGVNDGHPSLHLSGRTNGWIWANIRVRAGERYRISVDAMSPLNGAHFAIQTRIANGDGGQGVTFSSWTDRKSSDNTTTTTSYPFSNSETRSTWTSYWSEMTATADAVISFLVIANATTGASNTGPQYFRNFTMRAMTDGNLLVDGAVTARTLNVVPEGGSGGMELLPPGLRIIPDSEEGGTAVSLRVDEENWLAFAQNGMSTFSVSPSGHLVAQQIDANESLQYMGVELSTVLDQKRDGILARARMVGESLVLGTSEGRVVFATFRVPATDRSIRLVFSGRATADSARHLEINVRSATGNSVQPSSTSRRVWAIDLRRPESFILEEVFTVNEWGLTPGSTVTVGIFIKSISSTDTVRFVADHGQFLTIEDAGIPVVEQTVDGWAPPTGGSGGGSGGQGDTKPREYVQTFTPTWHQSYLSTGGQNMNGASRMYHGNPGSGVLTSMIGFSTAVQTFIGSGTVKKVEVWLRNTHTWNANGMTARIGWHKWGTKQTVYDYEWTYASTYGAQSSFSRGQGRWITMPIGVRNALIGSEPLRGIVLDPRTDGTQYYGHFNGPATMLRITVEK